MRGDLMRHLHPDQIGPQQFKRQNMNRRRPFQADVLFRVPITQSFPLVVRKHRHVKMAG
jgi:hypothetical protein